MVRTVENFIPPINVILLALKTYLGDLWWPNVAIGSSQAILIRGGSKLLGTRKISKLIFVSIVIIFNLFVILNFKSSPRFLLGGDLTLLW